MQGQEFFEIPGNKKENDNSDISLTIPNPLSDPLILKKDTYSSKSSNKNFVAYNLVVGKIKESNAVLIADDYQVMEFPVWYLPQELRKGNILRFTVERSFSEEETRKKEIINIQQQILNNNDIFIT